MIHEGDDVVVGRVVQLFILCSAALSHLDPQLSPHASE